MTNAPLIDKDADLPSAADVRLSDSAAAILGRPYRLETPRPKDVWTPLDLREHLQWAINVEHYTIPFYMATWFSIKDQADEAARLVKSIVNQEMLHLQSAVNVYNAFQFEAQPGQPDPNPDPVLGAPAYGGQIPHLKFSLNKVDPTTIFSPYSTEIGPLDMRRLNMMCIVEYPKWFDEEDKRIIAGLAEEAPEEEYGSIGELYQAIRDHLGDFEANVVGGRRQVDIFENWYANTSLTVSESGSPGFEQVKGLVELIVSQGEGKTKREAAIPTRFQNPANDPQPAADHFEKFNYLRGQPLPDTWPLTIGNPAGRSAQEALLEHYAQLLNYMRVIFHATPPPNPDGTVPDNLPLAPGGFGPVMFKVGAAIAACWQNGALPMFSNPEATSAGDAS